MLASMGMARLDPSPWNLGGPLMAIAACGPLVPVDDAGGTDTTDVTTVGEGPNPTGPNPTGPNPTTSPTTTVAMTTSPSCYDVNCPPGYHCQNGYCVYDGCYYADGGDCCYDTCCGFECGWYGECYSNGDCQTGYFCEYNQCVGAPAEFECAIVSLDFQIPIDAAGEVLSLAFVDGNGDAQRDLVIGQTDAVKYVDGASLSVTQISAGVDARYMTTGDLDGDGDGEVALSAGAVNGEVRILLNDGAWTPIDIGAWPSYLLGLAVGDVEGDGFRDIWAWSLTDGTAVAFNYGGAMFAEPQGVFDVSSSLAVGNADGDGLDDTAVYSYQTYLLTNGPAFDAWGLWDGASRSERIVTMANFNATEYDDVVVFEAVNGVTLVSSWAGPVLESSAYHSQWPTTVTAATPADMNVDGYVDIVGTAAGYPISIGYGAPEAPPDVINCVQYVASPVSAAAVAVGDITGDGRPDVAVSDGTSVVVLAQSG
jgi:hypothetical protein